jgi:hypothetical protein
MFVSLSPAGVVAAALIAPPGPETITALAPLIHTALPAPARVDLLVALERQSAWLASLIQQTLAKAGDAAEAEAQRCRDEREFPDLPPRAAQRRDRQRAAATRLESSDPATDGPHHHP